MARRRAAERSVREAAALEARGAAAVRAPAAEYADALLPAYTEPAAGGDQLQYCQAAMQQAAQQAQMRTLSGAPAVRCALLSFSYSFLFCLTLVLVPDTCVPVSGKQFQQPSSL